MPATLTEKPLNVRLPFEIATELEARTNAASRTKSFLMVEALRKNLHVQAWQVRDIKDGLAEADTQKHPTKIQ